MALNQIILNGLRFCSITFDLLLRHDRRLKLFSDLLINQINQSKLPIILFQALEPLTFLLISTSWKTSENGEILNGLWSFFNNSVQHLMTRCFSQECVFIPRSQMQMLYLILLIFNKSGEKSWILYHWKDQRMSLKMVKNSMKSVTV